MSRVEPIIETWNRLEARMRSERIETHKTRAIFAGALYAAAMAVAVNLATSREISETAHWIENQPDKVY